MREQTGDDRKGLLNVSLTKPRQKAVAIILVYKLFIYGDTQYESNQNNKYLLVETHFTEICACLTPCYSEFTAFTSYSTNHSFIHHIPQSTIRIANI